MLSNRRAVVHAISTIVSALQMPSVKQLLNRRYFVNVTSHDGEVGYFSRRQLSFSSDSFGFLLIRTDKPIYKPSQDGTNVYEI